MMQYDDNAEKYGYEGEMTTMKCDELKPLVFSLNDLAYVDESAVKKNFENTHDHAVYKATEVDAAITELKEAWRSEHEACEALKQKLEDVKASHYAEMVDAWMENRRLRRALWVTRTAMAKSEKDRWNTHIDCGNKRNRKDPAFIKTGKLLEVSEWRKLWADNERKCQAKAEEYR